MAEIDFSSDLVVILGGAATYQEVEATLANHLVELGYAKESFPAAIAEREVEYPTGLEVGELNAAMPHCDPENVNKAAVCVGVLKTPVDWRRMDDPDATCKVSLVTMLALNEAHAHLEMLQKVVGLIQDQQLMGQVVASNTKDEVFELVGAKLA